MSCQLESMEALLGTLSPARKNNYYYGKMLDVHHFEMEQCYGDRKRWLLNRLTLGDGVVCGLDVAVVDNALRVSCGVAIDCLGREIIVPTEIDVDPWHSGASPEDEPLPRDKPHDVVLSVCYRVCAADHAPVLVTDCDAREESKPGTIVETYRPHVRVLQEGEDPTPKPSITDACCAEVLSGAPPCDCQSDTCCTTKPCCVQLARATLTEAGTITDLETCRVRKRIYSHQQLMGMISCLAQQLKSLADG